MAVGATPVGVRRWCGGGVHAAIGRVVEDELTVKEGWAMRSVVARPGVWREDGPSVLDVT